MYFCAVVRSEVLQEYFNLWRKKYKKVALFRYRDEFSLFKPRWYDFQPINTLPHGTCRPHWVVFPPAGSDLSPQRVHPRHPPLQKSRGCPILRGGDGATLLYRYERVRHGDDTAHRTRLPPRDRAVSARQARPRPALHGEGFLVRVGMVAAAAHNGVGRVRLHAVERKRTDRGSFEKT